MWKVDAYEIDSNKTLESIIFNSKHKKQLLNLIRGEIKLRNGNQYT